MKKLLIILVIFLMTAGCAHTNSAQFENYSASDEPSLIIVSDQEAAPDSDDQEENPVPRIVYGK